MTGSTSARWLRLSDETSAAGQASLADIGKSSAQHDDDRNLANRMFLTATAMLESAVEIAVTRPSPRPDPSQFAANGRRLQATAHDIAVIAVAATVVADLGVDRLPNQRNRPR